jgi:hypothetical protein
LATFDRNASSVSVSNNSVSEKEIFTMAIKLVIVGGVAGGATAAA